MLCGVCGILDNSMVTRFSSCERLAGKCLLVTAHLTALLTLLVLAVDHYLAICRPLYHRTDVNISRVNVTIMVIWIASLLCSSFDIFPPVNISSFLPRDSMHVRGLRRRAVSVRLSHSCILSKRLKIRPQDGMRIRKSTQAFELYHFQWSWVTSNPEFKIMPLFDVEFSVTVKVKTSLQCHCQSSVYEAHQRGSLVQCAVYAGKWRREKVFHGIIPVLIASYIRPTEECRFKWLDSRSLFQFPYHCRVGILADSVVFLCSHAFSPHLAEELTPSR